MLPYEIMKSHPFLNSLSEKEKEIVLNIAAVIPLSSESVATIFVIHGGLDRQKTIDYIRMQYGFVIN